MVEQQPLDQSVAADFVFIMIYGIYFSTLLQCLRWLLFTDEGWTLRRRKEVKWPMLAATLLLFSFSFTNLILQLRGTLVALRTSVRENKIIGVDIPKPAWVSLVLCTNANLSILIGDLVMIHRCWVIYNKSRRIVVLPILLWLGGVALTALQAYWQIVKGQHILNAWQPINSTVGPGTILAPFWGTTILLNAYTSGFIIYRIWSASKSASKYGASTPQIRFVMQVLIESGVLYLATTTAHFIVWWTPNSFAILLVSSSNLQIIGIAFNLIFMRTSRRRADDSEVANMDISVLQFASHKVDLETQTTGLSFNVAAVDRQV
ncbi:hypothetical protein GALMADRAFT_134735 [Galerina marginata CBS 339.88]|uniref:Uncharacterized protein n=1 Tax=Galerina marginata (strain CBS 339.88) TaxID=685588 RepID=A0A067TJA0_GALM3|nr:hypothetical protein GALMADRAFT_134735 [Galerina marginata CBS 339.88]